MPTTLSVIPPVVPWAAAAGGAAVRLLQAGHMVVPSAICVPHPLQKAIDVSSQDCATRPPGPVRPALSKPRESYQNQPSKANRIVTKYACRPRGLLRIDHLETDNDRENPSRTNIAHLTLASARHNSPAATPP